VVSLDERSRCFLVKQGHASSVCQLNLRGLDDLLAVISASTDNIEIMHAVLEERAACCGVDIADLRPEDWLEEFYARRKGSGKPMAAAKPARSAQPSTRLASA
jgi:type IV secretion system protein VirB4